MERLPLKQIDFSATQPNHHGKEENLEQFGIRLGEIATGRFDQLQDIKARPVLERLAGFESDPGKRQGGWQLDNEVPDNFRRE